MKILYVTPRYYPHIGGVEYVVKSIAERLAKMGHEVTVLAGEPSVKRAREEFVNNVKVIRWPTWTLKEAFHIPRIRSKLMSTLKELIKVIDVAHIHSAHAVLPVYIGIKVKELYPNVKLIFSPHYHAHGHTLIRELAWQMLWRKYVRKLIKYSDKIHAVSVVEAERIVRHYPEAKDKLIIISNGVEEDVFQYKWKGQNSDYTIYAGRIEKYKRIDEAYEVIKSIDMNLKFFVVGSGPYLQKLKKKLAGKDVVFLPSQPRETYLQLLSDAKYAVNLSVNEAYSIFIAEALAIGVPCIASTTIAKALNAETQKLPYADNVTLLYEAKIATWNEVVKKLVRLYNQVYINL